MFWLVDLPFHSLGCLYDKASNRGQFFDLLKSRNKFLKVFKSVDSLNVYVSSVSIPKASQKI